MRIKVLVISERLWPEGSGAELATYLMLKLLRESFDIIVVSGTQNPKTHKGIKYIHTRLLSSRDKPRLWLNNTLLFPKVWFRKLLERVDIIYTPRFSFPIVPEIKKIGKSNSSLA